MSASELFSTAFIISAFASKTDKPAALSRAFLRSSSSLSARSFICRISTALCFIISASCLCRSGVCRANPPFYEAWFGLPYFFFFFFISFRVSSRVKLAFDSASAVIFFASPLRQEAFPLSLVPSSPFCWEKWWSADSNRHQARSPCDPCTD